MSACAVGVRCVWREGALSGGTRCQVEEEGQEVVEIEKMMTHWIHATLHPSCMPITIQTS